MSGIGRTWGNRRASISCHFCLFVQTSSYRRWQVVTWLGLAGLGMLATPSLSAQEVKPRATLKGHAEAVGSVAFPPAPMVTGLVVVLALGQPDVTR
jgi:hypothetical protein